MRAVVFASAAVMGLVVGAPAAADPSRPQPPVSEEQRRACRDDAFRLCPGQVALMRREGVRACLKAKAEELSPQCRSAFGELRAVETGGQP